MQLNISWLVVLHGRPPFSWTEMEEEWIGGGNRRGLWEGLGGVEDGETMTRCKI